jgi:hypothetical protein
MKKVFLIALLSTTAAMAMAQTAPDYNAADAKAAQDLKPKFGIKGGYNIAKITGSSTNFSPDAKNGFTVAAFYSPSAKPGLGYRTELVFSRQGFEFTESGKTGAVTNDYVYMPHFTTFGIGRFFQVQVGGQIGYLLKSSKQAPSEEKSQDITSFASRLDYGAAAGVELYPVKHLILGARYNVSFGNAYKQTSANNNMPSPFPLPFNPADVKGRNAVINIFAGIRF